MVQIGKIEYKAEVTGADEAEAKTESLTDSYAGMGEQATESAESAGFLGGTLSTTADQAKDAGEAADEADTEFTLLQGTIEGIGGGIDGLFGSAGFSGIGGLIQGGVALGQLVKGASFATLVKGAASLGALVIAADTISDIIDGKAPVTAFVDSVEDFGELVLNPIGIENDLVEGVAGLGVFIAGTASIASFITGTSIGAMVSGAGATIASFLGVSSLSSLVYGAGATIASFLGTIGIGSLVVGVGSIAALIFGVASLGDLVDGDISSWNLPAKFGKALGEGFRRAWPDMADRIHGAFTNNPIHGAGEWMGNVLRGEGLGAVEGENRELSPELETGFVDVDETPVLSQSADAGRATGNFIRENTPLGQQGASIQSGGLMRVHEGEELVPADITRDLSMVDNLMSLGGGGGGNNVTQVENITVELSGEFDPSDVSRRDLDSLADRLVDLIGDKTNRRAGVR